MSPSYRGQGRKRVLAFVSCHVFNLFVHCELNNIYFFFLCVFFFTLFTFVF